MLNKQLQSSLSGLVIAIVTVLVSRGVIGGQTASDIQTVALAVIAFGATVGVRSARR